MPENPDLMRGTLNTLLLEIASDQPRYGYEICQIVGRRTDGHFEMREGSLYPALHRLEREKLLKSSWGSGPQGRRRKYYQLTARGRRKLGVLREEWRTFSAAVNAVLSPPAMVTGRI